MRVKFWGTRGSVPTPGRATEKYGGNTTCVEVTSAGQRLILDGGTGIFQLGSSIPPDEDMSTALLFSHFHWDHIQGLPFFSPLFWPAFALEVYAPPSLEDRIQRVLTKQMEADTFPVDFGDLAADIRFVEWKRRGIDIGPFRVSSFDLNHPGGSCAYHIRAGSQTLVFATDNEIDPQGLHALAQQVRGADLLIADGQYTAQEYPQRRGWGHSAIEYVLQLARSAQVGRLAITHHDPMRVDEALTALEARTRQSSPELPLFFARDGMAVEVGGAG